MAVGVRGDIAAGRFARHLQGAVAAYLSGRVVQRPGMLWIRCRSGDNNKGPGCTNPKKSSAEAYAGGPTTSGPVVERPHILSLAGRPRSTKPGKSSAMGGTAGMTTTGRVVQRPRMLSLLCQLLAMTTNCPSYNDYRSCGPASGPGDDNKLLRRTTTADVVAQGRTGGDDNESPRRTKSG